MKVPGIRLPSWSRADGLSGWQRIAVIVGLAVVLLALTITRGSLTVGT